MICLPPKRRINIAPWRSLSKGILLRLTVGGFFARNQEPILDTRDLPNVKILSICTLDELLVDKSINVEVVGRRPLARINY